MPGEMWKAERQGLALLITVIINQHTLQIMHQKNEKKKLSHKAGHNSATCLLSLDKRLNGFPKKKLYANAYCHVNQIKGRKTIYALNPNMLLGKGEEK